MTPSELEALIARSCLPLTPRVLAPLPDAWLVPELHYGAQLPPDLKLVHTLACSYDLPGDWLSIEELVSVPTLERSLGRVWPGHLLPFLAVGNGDYFCLDTRVGSDSPVYYLAHDDMVLQELAPSLDAWLRDPSFFP